MRKGPKKFHTTLTTSVVAILFLIIVLILTVTLRQVFDEASVGQLVSNYILDQIPTDKDLNISIGSIDSALFTNITLRDISIAYQEDTPFLTAKRISIKVPAYRFLLKALLPKTIFLEVDQVEANLDERHFALLPASESPLVLPTAKQTLVLQLTNTNLEIALDNWQAKIIQGEALLTVEDGSLLRGRVAGDEVTFRHPEGTLESHQISLDFGATEAKEKVIRLHSEENVLVVESLSLGLHLATLDASMVGSSLKELMQVSGNVALNIQDIEGNTSQGNFLLANLNAQGQVTNTTLEQASLRLSTLSANSGPWKGELATLQGSYREQGLDSEISISSLDSLVVFNHGQKVGALESPLVVFYQNKGLRSLRLGFDSLNLSDISPLADLFSISLEEINAVKAQQGHFLLLQNRGSSAIHAETSFTMKGQTTLPFLSQFESEITGDVTLLEGNQIQNGEISFTNFKSDDLPGSMQGVLLYTKEQEEEPLFRGQVEHSSGILTHVTYGLTSNQARLALRFNETTVYDFSELIRSNAFAVGNLLVPTTTLEGNVNLTFALDGSVGRGTAEIGIANLAVDQQRFNIATTFAGALDPQSLKVDLATVTTEGLRLSYSGAIDRYRLFPEGILNISEVDSGKNLVSADFARLEEQVYTYKISSPTFPNTRLDGEVSWTDEGLLAANALLSVPGATYPVMLLADIATSTLTLDSENISAKFDLISEPGHLTGNINLSSFLLPPMSGQALRGEGFLNGSLAIDVSLADGLFLLAGDEIELSGLAWSDLPPWRLNFNLEADPQQLRLNDVFYQDSFGSLSGFLHLSNKDLASLASRKLKDFSLLGQFESPTGSSVELSFFPDSADETVTMGSLQISQFPLDRFGIFSGGATLESTFIGETNLDDMTRAHAKLGLKMGQDSPTEAQLELHVTDSQISLERGLYSSGKLQITLPKAVFPFNGEAVIDLDLRYISDLFWRDGDTTASIAIRFSLPKASNIFEWADHALALPKQLPPFTITHTNTLFLGAIPWGSGSHEVTLENQLLTIKPLQGGNIRATYALDRGDIELLATRGFPILLHAVGNVNGQTISIAVEDIEFDMRLINAILLEPILDFISGTVRGSFVIDGALANPEFFGTLRANSVEMTTFWTPGEILSLKNPIITISEHLASVAPTSVSILHTSGRRSTAMAQLEASIENWNFPHYRVDAFGLSNPISLWLPLKTLDVNIETMVSGTFAIDGTPTEETLYGDVIVSDGSISFGVPELPSWVVEKERTSIDMSIQTGKNVSFIYPNTESPILRATFADNQRITLVVQAPQMTTSIGGQLAFRSGEIYYVQKNFYITEGALKFPSIMTDLTGELLPTLSLRARLREFEPDGSRVDIYLVLQDDNLLDLTPRFESIPIRSTNEILELLGQNIVTAGTGSDSGFTSVVAVASAATDVFSRLGLLQNTTISLGFSSIVRDSLGLDVFTIRTNLLQNILFDALPGIAADTSVSPLARYLDNTTMYIGKYVLDEFYLQGMFHFRRDSLGKGTSFLAQDLRIDTELSIEWSNPLATFSLFTQPEELSVFDLFDTMGFSIIKRFEF
ncbi:MAG: hypothetical protein PHR10_02660 [Sphaerochaetaceae bacterium]|nr:hypothetical protein [Sphaerochaetaceae bacterium]